jgi:hypothetical protein
VFFNEGIFNAPRVLAAQDEVKKHFCAKLTKLKHFQLFDWNWGELDQNSGHR